MERLTAVATALAKGDWKIVLALEPDNVKGLLLKRASDKAAMEKGCDRKRLRF